MKNPFRPGENQFHSYLVKEEDLARFEQGLVHQVFSTFALAREAEWSGRLFVLEMKEEEEEGIGTSLSVEHRSPALLGQKVDFESELVAVKGNEVLTRFVARVGDREVARGTQGQKILKKSRLATLFDTLRPERQP